MLKRMLIALMFLLAGTGIRAASMPPPVILRLIIRQITGFQHNDMVIFNNGNQLKLRVAKKYEIFNKKSKLVLKGNGKEIDIAELPKGKYTIRFDGDPNQIESFEK